MNNKKERIYGKQKQWLGSFKLCVKLPLYVKLVNFYVYMDGPLVTLQETYTLSFLKRPNK